MSTTTRWRRLPRVGALCVLTAILLGAAASPASAAVIPAPVSDLAAALGPHGVVLSWTPSGTAPAVVRDVTALTTPFAPTDGRLVPVTGTTAYDTSFTNTASSVTYAVWAADTDGTLSDTPTTLTVSPLPALPTTTQLDAPLSSRLYGQAVVLHGKVTRAGLPFPFARVRLRSTLPATGAATTLATLTADASGTVTGSYVPDRSRTYQLVLDADAFSQKSTSAVRSVVLRPRVTTRLPSARVAANTAVLVQGTVRPVLPGATVRVQRYYSGAWHAVATRYASSKGTWSYRTTPPVGSHSFRAVVVGTSSYGGWYSSRALLTVVPRTLKLGMRGGDVLAVEKRLAALHYVPGKVDGYFDANLLHAVRAFQKVEGLARTDRWATTERNRVRAPRGFRMRYKDDRLTAEVDVTRQVMALGRNGKVLTIVDVSTGSEKAYYQDGVKNIAHTPRGTFSIYRKIDGIRVSKLGELYRPSYWHQGWAVHGSASVPTYAASHGCVRTTNYVTDLLYSRLVVGTRVAVYDS